MDAATALNAAVRAAAEQGLSVRLDVSENSGGADEEPVPTLRARTSRRIV